MTNNMLLVEQPAKQNAIDEALAAVDAVLSCGPSIRGPTRRKITECPSVLDRWKQSTM